jgi:hypothetical protein
MLGTQAQYPNQYPTEAKPVKGRSWRKLVIVVALLALGGIGGWWMYQNSTAGQAQAALGQMNSISAPAVAGQLPDRARTRVKTRRRRRRPRVRLRAQLLPRLSSRPGRLLRQQIRLQIRLQIRV